jgi:molecular chaperone GrpE
MSDPIDSSPPGSPPTGVPQPQQSAEDGGSASQGAAALDVSPEALALAQARAQEMQDLYLRARADLENLRRRSAEDVTKAHKFAVESFAEALVPVKDSLEMALAVQSPSIEALLEGVQATLNQLRSAFEKNKLLEINPVGEKFDPNRHQAISMVPGSSLEPAVAPNHVVNVLQKGYLLHERVLRPAMVTVAQG